MTDSNDTASRQDHSPRGVPKSVERDGRRSSAAGPSVINSESLFAGTNEVQIEHQGILYRLRRTQLGKLILTK